MARPLRRTCRGSRAGRLPCLTSESGDGAGGAGREGGRWFRLSGGDRAAREPATRSHGRAFFGSQGPAGPIGSHTPAGGPPPGGSKALAGDKIGGPSGGPLEEARGEADDRRSDFLGDIQGISREFPPGPPSLENWHAGLRKPLKSNGPGSRISRLLPAPASGGTSEFLLSLCRNEDFCLPGTRACLRVPSPPRGEDPRPG